MRPVLTGSLGARLLGLHTLVLAVFLGAGGAALDRAFRDSARAAEWERLQAEVYMLLGAAEVGHRGLVMPEVLPDPRLSTPGSGLYARISDADGRIVWHSESLIGTHAAFTEGGDPGTAVARETRTRDGRRLFALSYAVAWELAPGDVRRLVFSVAASRAGFDRQVSEFRRGLWIWFVGLAALLLLVQGAMLRWGLAPLRRVAEEVTRIEAGRQSELAGRYPRELEPLTRNLNALIRSGREHLKRYRNALADLAHSLKTPLAVLHANVNDPDTPPALRTALEEQLARIDQTLEYQLQRAAASGRTALSAPVPVLPALRRVAASLEKVYRDKAIEIHLEGDEDAAFPGDEGDLLEICGNLVDNACKWCERRITLRCARREGATVLEIEDDGPGVPPAARDFVLARGARADQNAGGQGIGLAVVRELVEEIYAGELDIAAGARGGALIRVTVPE